MASKHNTFIITYRWTGKPESVIKETRFSTTERSVRMAFNRWSNEVVASGMFASDCGKPELLTVNNILDLYNTKK